MFSCENNNISYKNIGICRGIIMVNLLLIIRTLSSGGAEKVVANLSIELSKSFNVFIVLFDGTKIDYEYTGTLLDLKSSLGNGLFNKIKGNIKRISKLKKIKKRLNITHSISFLDTPNLINVLSKKDDKIITSIRNYNEHHSKIKQYIFKYIYKKSDKVVSVSKLISRKTLREYKFDTGKIITIYNPYDIEKISKLAGMPQIRINQLVHVGRFTKQKNHINMLKILIEVKKIIPNIKLLLLGDGPLRDEIKIFIMKNDLGENVDLLGFVKNPYKFIAESNLFIFPSLFEGFPNALAEAMACGTPVIASDCNSGPREILAPNTEISFKTKTAEFSKYGILAPIPLEEKNISIWSNTIIKLLQDKSLYNNYSSCSKERVKDFKIETIIKSWKELF